MARIIRKRGAVKNNFPRKAEFIQHVRMYLAKARACYPEFTLEDKDIPIVFYKNGRTAGMAKWLVESCGGVTHYNLEFSIECINIEWEDMVNDTIPHEVAHIVDRFIHGKSNNHNRVWQAICRRIGGRVNRTHNYAVTKARKVRKIRWRYLASCGTELWISTAMHNKIQRGQKRKLNSTGGKLYAEHCLWERKEV